MPTSKASRVLFKIAFIVMFGPVYGILATVGLRVLMPAVFGMKLSRLPLPFVSNLDDFKSTHELDIACLSAVGLFFFISQVWDALMQTVLYHEGSQDLDPRTNVAVLREVFRYGGIALLILDAIVIFLGVLHQAMWSAGVFSATVVTALYAVLMVMGAATAAYLKHN